MVTLKDSSESDYLLWINWKFSETKADPAPELKAIDPAEFFRNFGRASTEGKKSVKRNGNVTTETNLSEEDAQIIISPQTSPRKLKQARAAESKKERKTIGLNSENCKSSEPSATSIKTKKSPRTAASTSIKSVTMKKDVAVLNKKESQMQGTKKTKEKVDTKKKFETVDDDTNKTVKTDIITEKKSKIRMTQKKSSKLMANVEEKKSKFDKSDDNKSPAGEVSSLFKFPKFHS